MFVAVNEVMIMKGKKIAIFLIVIAILFIFLNTNYVFANNLSWDSITKSAQDWEAKGKNKTLISEDKIVDAVLPVGQMLTAIGVAVLFGGIVILGIKYMISEPEQKGKLKQQLIGLVVAGVVIFGSYTICNLLRKFLTDVLK